MAERIRILLERFPEDENAVRMLVDRDSRMDALCQEYSEVLSVLRVLESDLDRLRKRRTMLEEEIMMRIEGHQPM